MCHTHFAEDKEAGYMSEHTFRLKRRALWLTLVFPFLAVLGDSFKKFISDTAPKEAHANTSPSLSRRNVGWCRISASFWALRTATTLTCTDDVQYLTKKLDLCHCLRGTILYHLLKNGGSAHNAREDIFCTLNVIYIIISSCTLKMGGKLIYQVQ